jgi:hypothetical protein
MEIRSGVRKKRREGALLYRSEVRKEKRKLEQEWRKERNVTWRAGWSKEGKGDVENRSEV